MDKKKFHGAFVFRNHGHGILSSTYFNTTTVKPYPETAILKKDGVKDDPFVGEFESVWLQRDGEYISILTITKNVFREYPAAYKLQWHDKGDRQQIYEGIGNLEDKIMIGCYWEV